MKETLHRLAPIFCLLTLLLNAATCLHAEKSRQPSCSHCPKPAPQKPQPSPCCAAQQLPHNEIALLSSSPITRLTASPPPRLTSRFEFDFSLAPSRLAAFFKRCLPILQTSREGFPMSHRLATTLLPLVLFAAPYLHAQTKQPPMPDMPDDMPDGLSRICGYPIYQ
jgi:hypothetical protein